MIEAGETKKHRLFIAVPLAHDLDGFVRRAQDALPRLPGLRLLDLAQLHITLAFIGGVDAEKAAIAGEVVEDLPADMGGEAQIERFLMLPSASRARVVTLELADDAGVLGALFEKVMGRLEGAGVMEREKRPFRPHLTIARLREPGPVRPTYESGRARFAIQSVCLYESQLRRGGAVYTVVRRRVLEPGGTVDKV